jgi:NADH-quinone oxidoreductase subunit L
MTRMMIMTFWGKERFYDALPGEDHHDDHAHDDEHANAHADDDDEEHHHALPHDFKPHESPWSMTVPLIALAILSTIGGLVGIPYAMSSLVGAGDVNAFEHTLDSVIAKASKGGNELHSPAVSVEKKEVKHFFAAEKPAAVGESHEEHSPEVIAKERWLALLSTVLAFVGIGIGFALFRNNPLRKMPLILEQKWRLDEFYNGYIVDPITKLSREGLWKGFDLGFIDGVVNGIGHFVSELGNLVRHVQVGFVRSYAAFIMLGAIVVLGYFIYYGLKLVG